MTGPSIPRGWGGVDASATVKDCKFLPDGELVFEFSVHSKPKEKAQADYNKRKNHPKAKGSIFVYATPREWAGANIWAENLSLEREFQDVVALDGGALFAWLQTLPPLHLSFSEEHGYRSSDIQTLTGWWNTFQDQLRFKIPHAFFLAGREDSQQQLISLIDKRVETRLTPTVLGQTEEDSLAFIYAALSESKGLLEKAVVVSTEQAFQWLLRKNIELIVIPTGAIKSILTPDSDSVIVVQAKEMLVVRDASSVVTLPAIGVRGGMQELQRLKNPDVDPRYLAELAHQAFYYFLIEVFEDPTVPKLTWTDNPSDMKLIARLVLLGAWIPQSQDEYAVEFFLDRPYEEIEERIQSIASSGDSPFVKIGKEIHVARSTVLAKVLREEVLRVPGASHLELIKKVVFSETAFDASPCGEDLSLRGKRDQGKYSRVLQDGLVNSLPLLAVAFEGVDRDRPERLAKILLHNLLLDENKSLLSGVSRYLPQFAETAPDEFISVLMGETEIKQIGFYSYFQEGSEVYLDFLRSLQVLTWSRDYLSLTSGILVDLATLDLPKEVESEVLQVLYPPLAIWFPLGAGKPTEKKNLLSRALRRLDDDTGWKLLTRLLQIDVEPLITHLRPRFRSWSIRREEEADSDEYCAATDFIFIKAIKYADKEERRWSELLSLLSTLPPERAGGMLDALEDFSNSAGDIRSNDFQVWYVLQEFIRRQSSKPNSYKAVLDRAKEVSLNLLEKSDPRRYALLFDVFPTEWFASKGPDRARVKMELKRREVLGSLVSQGQEAVAKLASVVQNPNQLGVYLADLEGAAKGEYLPWILSQEPTYYSVAEGYIGASLSRHGTDWLEEAPGTFTLITPEMLRRIAEIAPPTKQVWEYLGAAGEGFSDIFWRTPQEARIPEEDRAEAVQILLQRGQYTRSIKLMVWMLDNGQEVDLAASKEVLTALWSQMRGLDGGVKIAYPVSRLLAHLEERLPGDIEVVCLEFQFYRLLTMFSRPQNDALFKYLSKNPRALADLIRKVLVEQKCRRDSRSRDNSDGVDQQMTLEQVSLHWPSPPSLNVDSPGDGLQEWVDEVLDPFSDRADKAYAELLVGRILGANSDTENWPSAELCEVVEEIGSRDLEEGLYVRLHDEYSTPFLTPKARVQPEWELAERFARIADRVDAQWGRMNRLLRALANHFAKNAHRN